jgi:glycosyltransferase involved in cell wall biosynthesis
LIQLASASNVDMQYRISACVITYNEVDRIRECIESLSFCDEILVVDSHSQDGTRACARECGARVVKQDWLGHIAQKAFATRAASHEWVLCLDADERISDALRAEILIGQADGFRDTVGYHMPRLSQYQGKWIRHGTWYPNRRLRLFDRRRGHWGGVNPHDSVTVDGRTQRLRGDLLHIPYRTRQEQLHTIDQYTSIAAEELLRRGCSAAPLRMVFNPVFRVIRSLVLKLGFLDGKRGITLAVMEARYAFLKYRKLLALRRQRNAPAQMAPEEQQTPRLPFGQLAAANEECARRDGCI